MATKAKFTSLKAFLVLLITCIIVTAGLARAEVQERTAVWQGKFYPASPHDLSQAIDSYLEQAKIDPSIMQRPGLKAVLMPHAGYVYSGPVAAYSAKLLKGRSYTRVILLGPDHRVGFQGCAITDKDCYVTPLGKVFLDKECRALLGQEPFKTVAASDQSEHSLEVELPFLQKVLGEFKIIPIVTGSVDPKVVASLLLPLIDDQTLVVVSSDLSHYLPYENAVAQDRRTLQYIENFDVNDFQKTENSACGKIPLLILMHIAQQKDWKPVQLKYLNSGDTAGYKDRVVGYGSIAWFAEESSTQGRITPREGEYLVSLARKTIALHLTNNTVLDIGQAEWSPALKKTCAAFVTLTKNGQLRGCIGHIIPQEPLAECVRDNALAAAFSDPRFPPVRASELADLSIEVSVLTPPKELTYSNGQDLVAKLTPGVDGVILKKDYRQATFLPQVWEQLPEPSQFLSHLCAKAGLDPNAWRDGTLAVYTYRVQAFHEGK